MPEDCDMYEWVEFLRENCEKYFGQDLWEFAADVGEVVDVHFICQMECLKRSLKSLQEQNHV